MKLEKPLYSITIPLGLPVEPDVKTMEAHRSCNKPAASASSFGTRETGSPQPAKAAALTMISSVDGTDPDSVALVISAPAPAVRYIQLRRSLGYLRSRSKYLPPDFHIATRPMSISAERSRQIASTLSHPILWLTRRSANRLEA